jgi:calcium-dependent protein kinase
MLDEKLYLNKERLWQLFKYYDSQNRNYLGIEDLKETFAKEGSK